MIEQSPQVETVMLREEIIAFKEELRATRHQGVPPLEALIAVELATSGEAQRETIRRARNEQLTESRDETTHRVMLDGIAIYDMLRRNVDVRSEYWAPQDWPPEVFVESLECIRLREAADG